MAKGERINVRAILADPDLRRKLMVPTIQATQARERIETTTERAERAYYIVAEAEQAAFFGLAQCRRDKISDFDDREDAFVHALRDRDARIRFDVSRRDFQGIESSPLAYERLGSVAHIFREAPSLEPSWGVAKLGSHTSEDARLVRFWWEVTEVKPRPNRQYVPFAKGGPFSRFYYDIFLRVAWDAQRRSFSDWFGRKGRVRKGGRPESLDDFFKPGLTWPRAGSYFSVRHLPAGCIFADKGPAVFPKSVADTWYLAGVLSSTLAEYILGSLTSRQEMGARWEVGVVKRFPVPIAEKEYFNRIALNAEKIHDAKASWDLGNETSTRIEKPWIVRADLFAEAGIATTADRLDAVLRYELESEARIQHFYAELNDDTYRLYGIPDAVRAAIEESLRDRPPEVLWPQMEGKATDQKRMEHVFRLLAYAVKRVAEADDDGIVPFSPAAGEPRLVDRVRHELSELFPGRDPNQLEVEITNELKRSVKGYRKTNSIAEWLESAFFEYHARLYWNRPIYWHLASAQGTASFAFGVLVHYHRFDKNRMAKLRSKYLRDTIEELKRETALASKEGRVEDRIELQAKVEEAQTFDTKLQQIQEGRHEAPEGGDRDYRILTPWKAPNERPKGWDPDIDDGVKVNIEPLEKAAVLRIAKVT